MAVVKFVEDIVSLLGLTKEKTKELTKLAKKFYDTVKAEKAGAKKAKGAKSDKPLNAYLSFSGDVRKQVKEVNPSMNPRELTAEIAKQWNEEKDANTETYQKYADKAAKDLEEYKKTKSEKSEKSASDASSGSGSESDSEKPEKPEKKKRAPSAYNVFYSLKYAEFSSKGMSAADAKKEISEVWGKLTPEEKEEYKGKELSPKKTKPAEKKSAAKPAADSKAADAKAADSKAADAAKPSVKKTKTADAKTADAKDSTAAKDTATKPEKKTAKAETKKDETKPKKAKKAEEVTDDEEEDIGLDAFDEAPPPKKNAAKKDVPK